MPESYPAPAGRPSPAPPELPRLPERRFQFSLRSLLAYMFGAAILATGIRYLLQYLEQLPSHQWIASSNVFICSLAFGGLLYYFVRAPFLVEHADRIGRRWRMLQDHRRDLDRWSRERRKQRSIAADAQESTPPPE